MSGRSREADRQRPAMLPLLDRLIDHEPEKATDAPVPASKAMEALANSVRRDLEMLLNERRRFRSWPAALAELARSPLGYGIPDCTAGSFNDQRDREAFRADVEATIRRFEPRFIGLTVRLHEFDARKPTATLRLRVEALLQADPAPEPICFDTDVDAVTSSVAVQDTGLA